MLERQRLLRTARDGRLRRVWLLDDAGSSRLFAWRDVRGHFPALGKAFGMQRAYAPPGGVMFREASLTPRTEEPGDRSSKLLPDVDSAQRHCYTCQV